MGCVATKTSVRVGNSRQLEIKDCLEIFTKGKMTGKQLPVIQVQINANALKQSHTVLPCIFMT